MSHDSEEDNYDKSTDEQKELVNHYKTFKCLVYTYLIRRYGQKERYFVEDEDYWNVKEFIEENKARLMKLGG